MVCTRSTDYSVAAAANVVIRPADVYVFRSPQPDGSDLGLSSEPHVMKGIFEFLSNQYKDLLTMYKIVAPKAWLSESAVIDEDEFGKFVEAFNGAAVAHSKKRVLPRLQLKSILKWSEQSPTLEMEEELLDTIYSLTVTKPKKLNSYKPGSSAVYGETNTNQMKSILDEVKVGPSDVFVDLGSGVGQFTCFAALHSNVTESYGIELAPGPAGLAETHKDWFEKLMAFLGREHEDIHLHHGSIDHPSYRDLICNKATVMFMNNVLFNEDLKQKMNGFFADCKNGTKIVSTAPLVLPRNRESQYRSQKDALAPISMSEPLSSLKDGVSWAAREAQFILTTIQKS